MSIYYRFAKLIDAPALALVHRASWQTTYSHFVDSDFISTLPAEHFSKLWDRIFTTSRSQILLALTSQEEIIGFILVGENNLNEAPLPPNEVFAFYLLKEYQQQGIGSKLFETVRCYYHTLQTDFCLWLLEENTLAKHFYQSQGGTVICHKNEPLGNNSHHSLCFFWPST